jgi:ketosteroid isomerase-like protein
MSQENVEIVRAIYEAAARRDDITPFELYSEDIVWDLSNAPTAALLTTPASHGHEGVRQSWRDAVAAFGDVNVELQELIDAGDRVLAVVHERHVGRASGVPVEATHLAVWTLAEGNVTRMEVFGDHAAALEAAGLSE